MSESEDNASEVVATTVRVALTAAGQLAEQAARQREAKLREAARESDARVATVQAQLDVERQLALRSVQDVVRRGDIADLHELGDAWQRAASWDDPSMVAERERIRDLSVRRFGVDPSSPAATVIGDRTPRDVPTAVAVLSRDDARSAADRETRTEGPGSRVTALVAHLEDEGIDADVAHARALAAQSHPTPVTAAAQLPPAAPKARRRARGRGGWCRGAEPLALRPERKRPRLQRRRGQLRVDLGG